MTEAAEEGRTQIELPGLSYLPRFIKAEEAEALIAYFGRLMPLWEHRHRHTDHARQGTDEARTRGRRLTRPVYWLGAWQFACLGYYAEPDHRLDRCVRAESFPDVMRDILQRLKPLLRNHQGLGDASDASEVPVDALPNSCLINYYGRELGEGPPRDYARLRMHRDSEPGPVIMFAIGQPGLLEFVDPETPKSPHLSVWTRHRSVSIFSGPEFKDRLYHRVSQVRTGKEPAIDCRLPNFEARRISVSFRHVPEQLITDFDGLTDGSQAMVRDYVEELAGHSAHFRRQLQR